VWGSRKRDNGVAKIQSKRMSRVALKGAKGGVRRGSNGRSFNLKAKEGARKRWRGKLKSDEKRKNRPAGEATEGKRGQRE